MLYFTVMPPSKAGKSSEGFEFDSLKLHLQLGHKQGRQKWGVCEEPSYWSDTVRPLPWLSYPVFRHCLTLPIFPSLSSSYHAPCLRRMLVLRPSNKTLDVDRQRRRGRERGRRDLEKALGYWDKTGERTVTFQPSFHIKSGRVVNE